MNSMLAFFSGVILAVMLQMNQGLSAQYGAYHAALYIHLVAAFFAVCVLLRKRELRSAFHRVPLWMYLGGVFGVVTMLCNNLSYGHISLTSIMSLGIFAQIVLSALMDHFGWFGTAKGEHSGLVGIVVALVGVVWLLDASVQDAGLYLLLSLAAGAAVIFTRVVNAKLAAEIGTLQSSLMNYLSGLPLCLVLSLVVQEQTASGASFQPWMWLGGVIGLINIIVCNVLVPRMSASRLTMLTLCGQLLCGVLLDLLLSSTLNTQEFLAGLTINAGILINSLGRYCNAQKLQREKQYYERIARIEREHWDYTNKKYLNSHK